MCRTSICLFVAGTTAQGRREFRLGGMEKKMETIIMENEMGNGEENGSHYDGESNGKENGERHGN